MCATLSDGNSFVKAHSMYSKSKMIYMDFIVCYSFRAEAEAIDANSKERHSAMHSINDAFISVRYIFVYGFSKWVHAQNAIQMQFRNAPLRFATGFTSIRFDSLGLGLVWFGLVKLGCIWATGARLLNK